MINDKLPIYLKVSAIALVSWIIVFLIHFFFSSEEDLSSLTQSSLFFHLKRAFVIAIGITIAIVFSTNLKDRIWR